MTDKRIKSGVNSLLSGMDVCIYKVDDYENLANEIKREYIETRINLLKEDLEKNILILDNYSDNTYNIKIMKMNFYTGEAQV